MKIGDRTIAADEPPYVIAEIGVNHDGSAERALALVEIARAAGADAVKLQLFETGRLLGRDARLAEYQRETGATDPFAMLAALELPAAEMEAVIARAHEGGLHAIVTIFSPDLVDAADRLPFDAYKTASPDIQNRPLIERLLATGKPLLLSTGAATLDEVERAAGWLGERPHLLLHCVSSYPTPDERAALGGRIALERVLPRALGYSDHTTSLDTGALAVAGGACLLEKHITYDRTAAGPITRSRSTPRGSPSTSGSRTGRGRCGDRSRRRSPRARRTCAPPRGSRSRRRATSPPATSSHGPT
jgi:N,N'-diacetyllegionaminate synthase